MLCYNCGQFGHRSDGCRNARHYELVQQTLMAQGRKPCKNCGKFGHPAEACWSLPNNAHLRPAYCQGPGQARQGQQTYNRVQGQGQQTYSGNQGQGQQINSSNQGQVWNGNPQVWNNMYHQQVINRLQENGNVSINQ
jgi:Zinc knuckle